MPVRQRGLAGMFRGPQELHKLDLKKFGGHKDEVSYNFNAV